MELLQHIQQFIFMFFCVKYEYSKTQPLNSETYQHLSPFH